MFFKRELAMSFKKVFLCLLCLFVIGFLLLRSELYAQGGSAGSMLSSYGSTGSMSYAGASYGSGGDNLSASYAGSGWQGLFGRIRANRAARQASRAALAVSYPYSVQYSLPPQMMSGAACVNCGPQMQAGPCVNCGPQVQSVPFAMGGCPCGCPNCICNAPQQVPSAPAPLVASTPPRAEPMKLDVASEIAVAIKRANALAKTAKASSSIQMAPQLASQ